MQESRSPTERFGSQQDRANIYEVHHPSPLGQPADPSQHLSSPSETEEERARRKAEEKKKDKQKKPTATAPVDRKALDHRPRPKNDDDDDDKADRKSSSAKTTAADTQLRRYNK
ncbi:hypothetical protein GX50_02515 [[Emmonsia] crescens]|uniref:Uncharacterized protein n=1 Tax=[Emmonsia] crescens TaxID=73230 RepID=A0A2B7ZLV7_9EURO|nr:hypothetical protein GX50_02515 [Emmonsia crescens]